MAYKSKYTGTAIDNGIDINTTQNSRLSDLEASKVNKAGDTMTGRLRVPSAGFMNNNELATWITASSNHNFRFVEEATDTDYYTYYELPPPDTGLTASNSYTILTKKNFLDYSLSSRKRLYKQFKY